MKKVIFISLFAISVLVNIVPLLIFRDSIMISNLSLFSAVTMILISANGILSYFLRHKGNFLSFGKPRGSAFSEDKDYTFTKEYSKEFFWQFLIYCLAIPFYIPCIFFVSKRVHLLWTLCVLLVPQAVFVVYGISNTVKDVKEHQLTLQKREQELKEQMQKEEMGRFK